MRSVWGTDGPLLNDRLTYDFSALQCCKSDTHIVETVL